MINKNKRGSHVGMILSFLIFITFIGFLYSVIEPATKSNEDKLNLIGYLKVELLEEFSADMSTLTIKVNSDPPHGCVAIDIPDPALKDLGVVVKNISGNLFPSHASLIKTEMTIDEAGVYKVYYAREFNGGEDIGSCVSWVEDTDYEISLLKTDREIFESRIINISEGLNNTANYEEIKKKLGLGVGDEFGFIFTDENKEFITGTEEKEVSTDIFVEEIPIQYIDSEANIKSGFLNIKVW